MLNYAVLCINTLRRLQSYQMKALKNLSKIDLLQAISKCKLEKERVIERSPHFTP